MSDLVESYVLCSFMEEEIETGEEREEFVSIFDRPDPGELEEEEDDGQEEEEEAPRAQEPIRETVDVEGESRKIFEEAFTQGEKAGYEMGLQRVEPLVKRLNHYISELEKFKGELRKESENLSVELALIFAEAVVLRSCHENKEIVGEMVKKALDICETKSDIVIRVRPDDAQYITCDGSGFLKVVPDDSMRQPGFVIETDFGDIDGRMSTQIEELKKRILG